MRKARFFSIRDMPLGRFGNIFDSVQQTVQTVADKVVQEEEERTVKILNDHQPTASMMQEIDCTCGWTEPVNSDFNDGHFTKHLIEKIKEGD